ncbi:MAG: hypothetical protein OXL95_09560 [Nitrospira sp.]|nr:hypothetical protein [Nitrospira sp.]MDE0485871.1 hypothetical protein [Nitrospira sp.]
MIEKANLPTTPYEYMGFLFVYVHLGEYRLEQLLRGASNPEEAPRILKDQAKAYADRGTAFVAAELGVWDTEESRLGIAAGLQKAQQQFRLAVDGG